MNFTVNSGVQHFLKWEIHDVSIACTPVLFQDPMFAHM
jgi:hypothetical protein